VDQPSIFRKSSVILGLAALATFASGCIPIAWVTPPIQLEASVGAAVREEARSEALDVSAAFPMSASIMPLQAFPSMGARSFDLGAGYHLLPATSHRFNHGPHIDLALLHQVEHPVFLDWAFGDATRARVGLRLRGQAFFGGHTDAVGHGAALQVSFEGFSFGTEDFSGCTLNEADDSAAYQAFGDDSANNEGAFCGSGFTWGETGFGLFAETSYSRIDLRDQWIFSLGVKGRLPATLGIGFIATNF